MAATIPGLPTLSRVTMRTWVLGALVVAATGFIAAPAHATHAYRCDLSDDPMVQRAACLPHHTWDAITGGRPGGVACAVERALGVDNVKECRAES
jgi:hypothetical protein